MSAAIFVLIVAAAGAFAAWPVLRRKPGRARLLLAASLSLFVCGVGGIAYLAIGRPALAMRGGDAIAAEVRHLHAYPADLAAWRRLGDAYLKAGDDDDAAKAYLRAIQVARAANRTSARLYSDYGAALVGTSNAGEAEGAFRFALALDPKDPVALYFMGFASAAQGRNAEAVALWRTLLDELPAGAKLRRDLAGRIAALQSKVAPDIDAMVAGLAARLKTDPDDGAGWQRLVRAYVVLGNRTKALEALADGRAAMAKNSEMLRALAAEARELRLER